MDKPVEVDFKGDIAARNLKKWRPGAISNPETFQPVVKGN
jgi:hypothetical protein